MGRAADVNINELDEEGRAALHYAVWNGCDGAARALLAHGADANVRSADRQSTPLHFAAGVGHEACVRALLDANARLDALDADKWTPQALAQQNLFNKDACVAIAQLLESERARD